MVRLTVNQTTHEEWLEQNSILSSGSSPGTELVQTDADDTTFFSCDEESIYESELANNKSRNKAGVPKDVLAIELSSDDEEANILPADNLELELSIDDGETNVLRAGNLEIELSSDDEEADILPADINDDSLVEKGLPPPQVPRTPRAPTIDITSDDDSEDDDVIFGSRRTPFVLGAKRTVSKEMPEIPIAIDEDSDKSDSEESDSSFAHSNDGHSDGSEFFPSPPPQKTKVPMTPFSISSPTKLNRTTSKPVPAFLRRLQGIRQELPDDQVLEEIQPSPRKQRPRISLKRDPTLSVVSSIPSLSNDEIDTLSRELGDLAVDEDSVLEHTPNRFKRPPKIVQRTSSRIFDISDSESDGEMEVLDAKKLNSTPKPNPVTTMTPRTTSKSGKPLAPATIARLRKKEFEETKGKIAKDYLKLLDDTVNDGAVGKLSAPTGGLQVVWTNSKQTTAGTCQTIRYGAGLGEEKTSVYFSCVITLESKVCDDVDRIKDTLAHEYTHACVDVLETDRRQVKSEGPHGRLFKTWAKKVGEAMNIDTPETCHNLEINYKFEYKCTLCDRIYKAHSRKPAWTTSKGCELCKVPLVQIKPVPRVAKGPTPYQTFQKETFAKLKQDLPPGTPFSLAKMQKEVNRLWKEEKSKNEAAGTAPESLLENSGSDNEVVETSLTSFEKLVLVIDD